MCQNAIGLINKSLPSVNDDELLLRIKGRIGLFIQTMEVCRSMQKMQTAKLTVRQSWGYSVTPLNHLVLSIFSKYSQLLKDRFSDDFYEIVTTDDYMPMSVESPEEFDRVLEATWYTPNEDREELTCVHFEGTVLVILTTTLDSLSSCPSLRCTRSVVSISATSSTRSTSSQTTTSTAQASSTITSRT